MRSKTRRQFCNNSALGFTIDWNQVKDAAVSIAPSVISAVAPKPKTTINNAAAAPDYSGLIAQWQARNAAKNETNYTPWLIGGGLVLAAGAAYMYSNSINSNKRKSK